jgi:hypothetical protein
MPSAQPVGPPVDDSEDVYRAILYPAHWNGSENRPSSAAFDDAVFSVDIASRTTVEQTRSRFRIVLQLVQFNCGTARTIGFDTRDEQDPMFPENSAHAHVYFADYDNFPKSKRKAKARRLAEMCTAVTT